ncbi:MAG: hypothetical protein KAS64_04870 [Spirochaetes bacterium]|nr:hypothetical protein [Spirochaetota bacterium]
MKTKILLILMILPVSIAALPDISGEKIAGNTPKSNTIPVIKILKPAISPFRLNATLETTVQTAMPPLGSYVDKWQIAKIEGRFRLDAAFKKGNFEALIQNDLYLYPDLQDTAAPRSTSLVLRQGWLRVGGSLIELTLGWQIFSWGNADILPSANLLDRPDFSDLSVLDRSQRYTGTLGLKTRIFTGNRVLELVFLPTVRTASTAPEDGFWHFTYDDIGTTPVTEKKADNPDYELKDSAVAVRWGGSTSGMDFHIGWYYGPQRGLLLRSTLTGTNAATAVVEKKPWQDRVHCFTLNSAFTIGKMAVRMETLFSPNMPILPYPDQTLISSVSGTLSPLNTSIPLGTVSRGPYLAWTIGADIHLWGNEGRMLIEWKHDLYLEKTDSIEDFRISDIFALMLRDKFFSNRLQIQAGGVFTQKKGEYLGAAGYRITWDFANGFYLTHGTFFLVGISYLQARYRF